MFPISIRVLVVDDMPTLRELVKQQLKSLGLSNIQEAEDGEAAWLMMKKAEQIGQAFEFVISDWNMPKLSGIDLLKKVRTEAKWTQLPFVLLTSESERDNVTEAILSGVSQYIVKPFTQKAFEEKLKSAWTKHHGSR
ncbi:MAG: response regulator [Bdellovibrio sp.]